MVCVNDPYLTASALAGYQRSNSPADLLDSYPPSLLYVILAPPAWSAHPCEARAQAEEGRDGGLRGMNRGGGGISRRGAGRHVCTPAVLLVRLRGGAHRAGGGGGEGRSGRS